MFSRRNRRRLQTFAKLASGWGLLAAYIAVASGVSIPTPNFADAGPAFPCQHGRCGCRTAEQCWKSCCCNTASERLAWAARNNVTPPAYVIAAAQSESTSCGTRSCCAAKTKSSPVETQKTSDEVRRITEQQPVVWVSLLDAQRCRGTTPTSHSVPISLPPQPPETQPAFEPRIAPLVVAVLPVAPSISFAPPVPPPRIG